MNKRNCNICKHIVKKGKSFRCEFKQCNMGSKPYYNDPNAKQPVSEFNYGSKVCEFIPIGD